MFGLQSGVFLLEFLDGECCGHSAALYVRGHVSAAYF
jgi:hypothetical protein